jgi:hypothetical protein
MTDTLPFAMPADQPKRPALALRRVHLRSVGPDKARLDPLDLDLTTDSRAATKVLWSLTNLGGKTTLIRLLCSVVVPRATEAMGRANIGEYVQSGDTTHVVLEWEDDEIGRFVVGAVYQWPNRTRPASVPIGALKRGWYTFRSSEVGIDQLPFEIDGRRRTFEDFRAQLDELFRNRPTARYVSTQVQSEWAETLDAYTPLDTELFRYQMRMNDEEGGADALVAKLTNPDAVVRFFVGALNDDAALADFSRTLTTYAAAADQRSAWEIELSFCTEIGGLLATLASTEGAYRKALDEEERRRFVAAELAGAIAARAELERGRIAELDRRHQAASAEADDLNRAVNRIDDIRRQLALDQALFAEKAAEARLTRANGRRKEAAWRAAAWRRSSPTRHGGQPRPVGLENPDSRREQVFRTIRRCSSCSG